MTTPMPPKLSALLNKTHHQDTRVTAHTGTALVTDSARKTTNTQTKHTYKDTHTNTLWMVPGIEGSLQDSSRKNDAVLGGHVIGVHSGWGHAPPVGLTVMENTVRWSRAAFPVWASPRASVRNSLVFVRRFAELVCHHPRWEVVEVQHVLEEVIFQHLVLETQGVCQDFDTVAVLLQWSLRSVSCVCNAFYRWYYISNLIRPLQITLCITDLVTLGMACADVRWCAWRSANLAADSNKIMIL